VSFFFLSFCIMFWGLALALGQVGQAWAMIIPIGLVALVRWVQEMLLFVSF
jgi:hypothetical protein